MTHFSFYNFTSCLRVKYLVLVALGAISLSNSVIKLFHLDNNKDNLVLMFVYKPLPYFNHVVRILKQLQCSSQHLPASLLSK